MAQHIEYLWNNGCPEGQSPYGVCIEGKCGAEIQICGIDPAEVLANLEKGCGHPCLCKFAPYVPDCATYLPPGNYRLAEGYTPGGECPIIAIRHIECDEVVVNVGCASPLGDGGNGGGGPCDCTVTGPIDVTIIGPDPLVVTLDGPIAITGTVDVNIVGPDPLVITPDPDAKFNNNICGIDDGVVIPVEIVNPQGSTDVEYACASDDGRVIVSVTVVAPDGTWSTTLLEADGVTPVPAGVVAGPCQNTDWESLGPKKICVRNIVDQYFDDFCIFTLINTQDTTQTISVMLDGAGNAADPGQYTVVPCVIAACPPLEIIPDLVADAGTSAPVAANAYGYVCIDVPCFKRDWNGTDLIVTEVSDDTFVTVTWDNGLVEILGKGERCCRDARGLCPLTGQPRTIGNSAVVTVVTGDGCAIVSGDI